MISIGCNELPILEIGHTIQLAGMLLSDRNSIYVCLLPDEPVDARDFKTLELSTEDWERVIRQTDILETEVLSKGADGKLAKIVLRKSTRQIDQKVAWAVYRRDGYRCRYCGADRVPLTVDHLVLWEHGGPSTENNLLSSCRRCNKTRGNLEYADWLQDSYYQREAKKLDAATLAANEELLGTLDSIPRQLHVRKR